MLLICIWFPPCSPLPSCSSASCFHFRWRSERSSAGGGCTTPTPTWTTSTSATRSSTRNSSGSTRSTPRTSGTTWRGAQPSRSSAPVGDGMPFAESYCKQKFKKVTVKRPRNVQRIKCWRNEQKLMKNLEWNVAKKFDLGGHPPIKFKATWGKDFCSASALVVEYLGWDDYHFGHSTVWLFLPGRGELGRIGWVAVVDGGTFKSMSTQPR